MKLSDSHLTVGRYFTLLAKEDIEAEVEIMWQKYLKDNAAKKD